jgi:hypothetical protein
MMKLPHRVVNALEGNVFRDYPIPQFVSEVWHGEIDALRLSPGITQTLPKPLRSEFQTIFLLSN